MPRKSKSDATRPTEAAATLPMPDKLAIAKRIQSQGIWDQVQPLRDTMMKEARSKGLSREQAQAWVYTELDRLYPATTKVDATVQTDAVNPEQTADDQAIEGEPDNNRQDGGARIATAAEAALAHARDIAARGKLVGLEATPSGWPALPASAPLASELGWVQANRLAMVSEPPNGAVRIDLSRAAEPAPSRSAIAWLETSIRNYAKFTDVLAKVASGAVDEGEEVRKEKVALVDIESLLDSMTVAQ